MQGVLRAEGLCVCVCVCGWVDRERYRCSDSGSGEVKDQWCPAGLFFGRSLEQDCRHSPTVIPESAAEKMYVVGVIDGTPDIIHMCVCL